MDGVRPGARAADLGYRPNAIARGLKNRLPYSDAQVMEPGFLRSA
jgi:hypothetical protein